MLAQEHLLTIDTGNSLATADTEAGCKHPSKD